MHKLRFFSVLVFCFLASFTQAQDFKIENVKGYSSPVLEVKGKGFAVVYDLEGKSKKQAEINFYDYNYNKISSGSLSISSNEFVYKLVSNDDHVAVILRSSTSLRMVSFEFESGSQKGVFVFDELKPSPSIPYFVSAAGDGDEFFIATYMELKESTMLRSFDSNLKPKWQYTSEGKSDKKLVRFNQILVLKNQIVAQQMVIANKTSQDQLISFSRSTGKVEETAVLTEGYFHYVLKADTIDGNIYTVVTKFPDLKTGDKEETKAFNAEQKESKTAILNYTVTLYDKKLETINSTTVDYNTAINSKISRPEKLTDKMMYTFPLQLLKTNEGYTLISQLIFWKVSLGASYATSSSGGTQAGVQTNATPYTYNFLMIDFNNTLDYKDFYLVDREQSFCSYGMPGLILTMPYSVYNYVNPTGYSVTPDLLFRGASLMKDGKIQLVYFDQNKNGNFKLKVGDNEKRSQELKLQGDEDEKLIKVTTVAFDPTVLMHNPKGYTLGIKTIRKSYEFFNYPRL